MSSNHDGLVESSCDIETGIIKNKNTGQRAIFINHGEVALKLYPDKARELINNLSDLLLKIVEMERAENNWSIQ